MGIGSGTALALGLGGAAIGAGGSLLAANTQAGAAKNAAGLQYRLGEDALHFQEQEWAQQQANIAPWLRTGQSALMTLGDLLGFGPNASGTGGPGPSATTGGALRPGDAGFTYPLAATGNGTTTLGSLLQPWTTPFQAPTAAQCQRRLRKINR